MLLINAYHAIFERWQYVKDGKQNDLSSNFSLFSDHWSPRVVAEMNDYQFKLVKISGEFVWHDHPETDEVFLVIEGQMSILFGDGKVKLATGDMYVVPKGVEHKPIAETECQVMIIEPRGVLNTGDTIASDLTAENDIWI